MIPERITIKFFADGADDLDITAFIPIFHAWIREHSVPGLLIDLADYKHVLDGPVLQLQGHDGDYYVDLAHGRFGILYRHKREWPSDVLSERVALVWERALYAIERLKDEEALGDLAFRTDEVELTFPDRLNVPNTAETFEMLHDELTKTLQQLTGDTVLLTHIYSEPRRPFTLRATIPLAPPLETLLTQKTVLQPA